MSKTVRERNGQDRKCRPAWESRPYYWPPPWGVPVGLRSPTGSAAPSWAPLNRACRCWAESGCLLALLLTEDTKGTETGVKTWTQQGGRYPTKWITGEMNPITPRQTWSSRLITNLPENKLLEKHPLPFTWPWYLTRTFQTGLPKVTAWKQLFCCLDCCSAAATHEFPPWW